MKKIMSSKAARIVAMLFALLTGINAHAAQVRAWLDRNSMQLGETVTLNVEVSDNAGAAQPDFNVLQQDFKDLDGAKAYLAGPPIMVETAANPGGLPIEVFDGFRNAYLSDRSQFFLDVASGPFFGFNRPGAKVSQGLIQSWWMQGMLTGHKNAYDCIKAFSETDFTADLKTFDVPTLILHGDDDQIVPIGASAQLSAKLVRGAVLKVYKGGSHALGDTSRNEVNADLLAFLKS